MVAIGDIWEGHEVLSELERGMVHTFLARQLGDTRDLVCLHIREGGRLEPDLFASEIKRLQHIATKIPEIVPVCDGGIVGSVAWAASPAHGHAVRLTDAPRGTDLGLTALKMLIDVGSCLVRAHELSAIHGLLSPDRVFLAGEDRTIITHFGFVRLFDLGADDVLRERRYAAPELVTGGRLGHRTDIYGFGTIMYELLCQREFSFEEEILPLPPDATAPDGPTAIPLELQWMIRKALAENPKRRQPSLEEMLAFLIPFARVWEELGGPPEHPDESPFAEPSASRRKPCETAPILVGDDEEPFASGEREGETGGSPSLLPSVSPETLRTGKTAQNDITTPLTPSVVPPLPIAFEPPDLEPIPPPPPIVPLSSPSGERSRRRIPGPLLGQVLALGSLLAAAWMFVVWQRSPEPADRLPRVIQVAAVPPSVAPPARALSGFPEAPLNSAPPIAPQPQPIETRNAVTAQRAARAPARTAPRPRSYTRAGNTAF